MRNKIIKYFFLLLVGLFTNFYIYAQDSSDNLSLEIHIDSSELLLNKWRASGDFKYIHYLDSLLRVKKKLIADTVRVDEKTGKLIGQPQEKRSFSFLNRILKSPGMGLLLRIVAIFFIGFIVLKVFLQSGFFSMSGKRRKSNYVENVAEQFREIAEYDQLIREAENNNNLNEATRYWYLKTLKNLADRELIQYSVDKTNHNFIRELGGHPFQSAFEEITRKYEYVWYGKFTLKPDIYDKIKFSFERLEQQITNVS